MPFNSWRRGTNAQKTCNRRRPRQQPYRPALQVLEERHLLAIGTFVENFESDLDPSQPGFASTVFEHATPGAALIVDSRDFGLADLSNSLPFALIALGFPESPIDHVVSFDLGAGEFVDSASVRAHLLSPSADTIVAFVGTLGNRVYRTNGVGGAIPIPSAGVWNTLTANRAQIGEITAIHLGSSGGLFDDLIVHVSNNESEPGAVSWAVDADGFWDNPANWSTGRVPGPGDDVVIDRPSGAFTVFHSQGTSLVDSLVSTENLVLLGGRLQVMGSINAPGTFRLAGGTLGGGVVESGTTLQATSLGGTLEGVTINGDLNLTEMNAQATISGGLALNGTLRIGDNAAGYGALAFSGAGSVNGEGEVVFGGGVNADRNALWPISAGATLRIGSGITVRGHTGHIGQHSTQGPSDGRVINEGTISADSAGGILRIGGQSLVNTGTLEAGHGATLDIDTAVSIDGQGRLASGQPTGTISLAGNLLGNTQNAAGFGPLSTVRLDGTGVAAMPQLLEAMGRDQGRNLAGLFDNFDYDALVLANNTYVRLVDQSDNAAGLEGEAIYTFSLVVPAGTTLDLNGLHLYTRSVQGRGTVLGGVVDVIPDIIPIAAGQTKNSGIELAGGLDEWTFTGTAGQSVNVLVNPGSGSPAPPTPHLGWAEVRLLDTAGNTLATASNTTSGAIVLLSRIGLPTDGGYRIQVRAPALTPKAPATTCLPWGTPKWRNGR